VSSVDQLSRVKSQIESVKTIMVENIGTSNGSISNRHTHNDRQQPFWSEAQVKRAKADGVSGRHEGACRIKLRCCVCGILCCVSCRPGVGAWGEDRAIGGQE
jgi:hypothetical protein